MTSKQQINKTSPSSPFGVGIIGMGNIAGHHMKALHEIEQGRLVAVCSGSGRNIPDDRYGVPGYSSVDEMLKHPGLDIVIICTPSGFHLEPALKAAAAGKHVIVEKPMEVTVERTEEMIAACQKAGVTLSCIFQNRFSSGYAQLKKAVDDGLLGKPVLGNAYIKWFRDEAYYNSADWRGTLKGDGGAALINQSIHTIDLLLNVMGPVKSVYGKVVTRTHDIEGEDLGVAILEFENGALGTIEGSTSIHEGFPEKLEIHGEEGSIILEGGKISHWNTRSTGKKSFEEKAIPSGSSNPMNIDFQLHKKQLTAIIDAIREGRIPPVNTEEALLTVRVINAIYKASVGGCKIEL
ncbi:MAG: Gfo/Idh/MocA family oxidoreductase [Cyclobacteriaceae bacterium]|nr:Gfo/Idh/MocA family oxidoreductase [Cyclobacteriaceae bacterium]